MDAYSSYNQILMHPSDEDKTTFITDYGNFCYKVMPFVLKNAGDTYQRLMDKVFQNQIEKNMKVYVDNMLVKSKEIQEHVTDLEETFVVLRKYLLKLNPEKCAIWSERKALLGIHGSPKRT